MDEKIIQNCICKRAYTEWKDIDWKKVLNDAGITKNIIEKNKQVSFLGGKDKNAVYSIHDNGGEFNISKDVHHNGSIPYATTFTTEENYKNMSQRLKQVLKSF